MIRKENGGEQKRIQSSMKLCWVELISSSTWKKQRKKQNNQSVKDTHRHCLPLIIRQFKPLLDLLKIFHDTFSLLVVSYPSFIWSQIDHLLLFTSVHYVLNFFWITLYFNSFIKLWLSSTYHAIQSSILLYYITFYSITCTPISTTSTFRHSNTVCVLCYRCTCTLRTYARMLWCFVPYGQVNEQMTRSFLLVSILVERI